MPANPRPSDIITPNNLLIGMPYVEFGVIVGGVVQPLVSLGIVDSAELAKELDTLALESSQSGTRVTVRELITRIDPTLNVGVFNLSVENLQYVLGSSSLTPVTANATQAVTDERVTTTTDPLDFLDLANRSVNAAGVVVTPATNTLENLGTSDGNKGDASGEFFLRFKVNAIGDVTLVRSTTSLGVQTVWTVVAVGGAMAGGGNQVEVAVGTGATSGNLQFFDNAGVAVNIPSGAFVEATYTPSFTLTEGIVAPDDYTVDRKNGRIRVIHEATKATGTQPLIAGQAVFVDYTYNRKAHTLIQPFTQTSFLGVARVRHLADVGINLIWDIPSAQILLDDTSFEWSGEEFTVGTLALKILDAGGSARFGTIQVFSETQANA